MSQIDINTKEVWTIEDVSNYTSYEVTYIQKMCSARMIPHTNPPEGRRVFFKREKIIAWLTANEIKTKDEINNPDKYKKNEIN